MCCNGTNFKKSSFKFYSALIWDKNFARSVSHPLTLTHNLTRPPTRTHSLLSHALTNFHMHTLSSKRIGRVRIVFICSFVFFAFLTFISLGRSLFPICHCPSMTTNTLLVSIPLFTLDQSPSPSLSLSLSFLALTSDSMPLLALSPFSLMTLSFYSSLSVPPLFLLTPTFFTHAPSSHAPSRYFSSDRIFFDIAAAYFDSFHIFFFFRSQFQF